MHLGPGSNAAVKLVVLILFGALSFQTQAQAVPAEHESSAPEPYAGVWSLGAGVGFGGYYSGDAALQTLAVSGLGYALPTSSSNWLGVGLVEVTLKPALRLGLNVTGYYSSTNNPDADTATTLMDPADSQNGSLGGAASLRWVLNPGELVEVSPVFALGGGWSHAELSQASRIDSEGNVFARRDTRTDAFSINARAGMTIEYRLLTRLYLRLEAYFVRADHALLETTERRVELDMPTQVTNKNLNATAVGLSVQPTLQLRFLL